MEILNDPTELQSKLLFPGFLTYQEYAEIKLLEPKTENSICYRCNESLIPLTYLDREFYYLPCWNCTDEKRKGEHQSIVDGIIRNVKEFYYSRILGDRYLQLFIIDPIYFKNTLPHDYTIFKKILSLINPPSRNDIWFLDWIPGYPKIINMDNIDGLQLVNLSELYDIEMKDDRIVVGEYEILFPELVTYDSKHHSRYSLFNHNNKSVKTKRLKIGDRCVKFYNTEKSNTKSIFRLRKNGEEVVIGSLRKKEFAVIKLVLMRNKNCLRLIFEIALEILKTCNIFRDTVFLRNTITVDPKKNRAFNLLWNTRSYEDLVDDETINISII